MSRSFGNFMATEGNERRLAEAEAMEDQARYLVEEFKAKANMRAKELNVRNTGEEAEREGFAVKVTHKQFHHVPVVRSCRDAPHSSRTGV